VQNFGKRRLGAKAWGLFASTASVLLSLTGCASDPVAVRTELVNVPIEVAKPIPEAYTTPLMYPAPFGDAFTCSEVVERVFVLYDALDAANADRAAVAELSKGQK
jgi:hypothetical protein